MLGERNLHWWFFVSNLGLLEGGEMLCPLVTDTSVPVSLIGPIYYFTRVCVCVPRSNPGQTAALKVAV